MVRLALLFASLLLIAQFGAAQTSVDVGFGFGTAKIKSNGSGIYGSDSSYAFESCSPGSGNSGCLATPSLSGPFLGFSSNLMLSKHFGFGGEVNFQPVRRDYGPLEYRQIFYDFNGVFAPVNREKVAIELQGGMGGTNTNFAYVEKYCIGTAICSNTSQSIGSVNHFQLHFGAGVKYYLTKSLFIRPQFDLHYVPNFTEQFGGNVAPRGTIWIGFAIRNQ
jgi:hypothetical protein